MLKLTIEEFKKITAGGGASENICTLLSRCDLSYRMLTEEEHEEAFASAIIRINEDQQIVATSERTKVWQDGWQENLDAFIMNGYDPEALVPKFFRPNVPIRLFQEFVMSDNPRFEYDFGRIFKQWIFETYFGDYDNIYEFGCGTGYNLIQLARMYPHKGIYGLDFVPSAVKVVDEIHNHLHSNISGLQFNAIQPDYECKIRPNSAIFTMQMIEQISNNYIAFIDYLLAQQPALCIYVEPIYELYDCNVLIDSLAMSFHAKRHYPVGFLPYLKKLEAEKRIEILKICRPYVGNYNHEGYSMIVWKPIH